MKILILEGTQVNYQDDRGGIHQAAGDIVDCPKEVAKKLVEVRRALYVNKADDPSKGAVNTASKEELAAAKALAEAAKKPPQE